MFEQVFNFVPSAVPDRFFVKQTVAQYGVMSYLYIRKMSKLDFHINRTFWSP